MKNYPFTDEQLKKLHADMKKLVDYAGSTPTIRAPNPRLEVQGLAWKKLRTWLNAKEKTEERDTHSDHYDARTSALARLEMVREMREAMRNIEVREWRKQKR